MRTLKVILLVAIVGVAAIAHAHGADVSGWNLLTNNGPLSRVSAAVFKNTIYAVETRGGREADYDYNFDPYIYSSSDGENWTRTAPPWPYTSGGEFELKLVTWRDMLWAMIANDGSTPMEIWRTADGKSWSKLTSLTPKSRDGFAVAVFQDKLWLTGGETRYTFIQNSEIWNTDDGTSWSLVAKGNGVGWQPRSDHALIVFQDKLWVIGGRGEYDRMSFWTGLSDVWSSDNGRDWVLKGDTGFAQGALSAVVYNEKIYALGGEDHPSLVDGHVAGDTLAAFNSSSDGIHWSLVPGFGRVQDHASVVFNGLILVLGGGYWDTSSEWNDNWTYGYFAKYSSVWAIPDTRYGAVGAVNPVRVTLPRRSGQTISIDIKNTGLPWSSSAGTRLRVISDPKHVATMTTVPLAAGAVVKTGETYRFTLPVDLSKLWGGAELKVQMYQPGIFYFGEAVSVSVNYTFDHPIGWHRIETPDLKFYGGDNNLAASGNDLWLQNWRSMNGHDWIRTGCAELEPWDYEFDRYVNGATRHLHEYLNGLVYFRGKFIALGAYFTWTSTDGMRWSRSAANWTEYEGDYYGRPRVSSACILGDKLFVMINYNCLDVASDGGLDYIRKNDIWTTTDGSNWTKLCTLDGLTEYGRMVAFQGKLWTFGGNVITLFESESMGGFSDYTQVYDLIHSSSDGITWNMAGRLPRASRLMGVAVYRDKLWAADEAGGMYSSDGINWEPATAVASIGNFQVFDDRLWSISKTGGLYCGSADAQSAMLSRSAIDFGRCGMLAATGPEQSVGVYNLGTSPLSFSGAGAQIISSRPGEFTFASTPNTSPVSVGGTRTIGIRFKPSRTGPTSATLRVTTNDSRHPLLTVKLTGEGVATQPFKSDSILAYILGKSNDATGLDKNSDSKINIADVVWLQNSPIQVTSPGSATQIKPLTSFRVKWKAPSQISNVKITLARNHQTVITIKKSTANDGSTTCTVPLTLIPDSNYSIVLSDADHQSVQGESQWFSIVNPNPAITVEYPNGGETLSRGSKIPIGWSQTGLGNARVELYKDDAPYQTLVTSTPPDIYYWTIPTDFATGGSFRIVVMDADDAWRRGYSCVFSIAK